MARHEFGIMDNAPQPGVRYDNYEPEKYNAISVDDVYIEPLMSYLGTIEMYWHTLDRIETGLAYCGITLIPPAAFPDVLEIIRPLAELQPLAELLEKAVEEKNYIIHFGL